MYSALIGYIWYEAPDEEMNFTTLLEMINASEAREDDPEFQSPVDQMFERLEAKDPDHFAVLPAASLYFLYCRRAKWSGSFCSKASKRRSTAFLNDSSSSRTSMAFIISTKVEKFCSFLGAS